MVEFNQKDFTAYEMNALALKFVNALEKNKNEYLENYYKQIKHFHEELTRTLGKQTNDPYTKKVRDKDDARDKLFLFFRDNVNVYRHSDDEAQVNAAQRISSLIEKQGNTLHKFNDDEETAALVVLFAELEKMADMIALIPGCGTHIEKLKKAQSEFMAISDEELKARQQKNYLAIKSCRTQLNRYIKSLLDFVNVSDEFFPERFPGLAVELDGLFDDFSVRIESRKTRKENLEKEQEETPGPVDGTSSM